MINTILFDMGGTLEDIWYNDQTIHSVTGELRTFLNEHDLGTGCNDITFWNKLNSGIRTYKQWSESNELEKKPEEIWPEYYMADFNLDREKLQEVAERLAGMWEVTYYHRELRPKVKETLEELKKRGYHLGVISNTASLYSVFDVLEQYGIRDYFEDVTLSSVTGYRKPHPSISRSRCARCRRSRRNVPMWAIRSRVISSVQSECILVPRSRSSRSCRRRRMPV